MRHSCTLAFLLAALCTPCLAQLAPGDYVLAPDVILSITAEMNGLVGHLTGHDPERMVHVSDREYALPALDGRLSAPRRGNSITFTRYGETMHASPRLRDRRRPVTDRLQDRVPAWMARYNVPGVGIALIRDRRVVWRHEFGVQAATGDAKIEENSVFEACSMSKPLFAYAALKLVEEGRLNLDRPLDAYLPAPYLPDEPDGGLITARMVLNHTTGLPNWRKGGWRRGNMPKLLHKPGTRFTYSGEGITYLMVAVEAITGTPLEAHMRPLLDRIGMPHSSYVWQERYQENYAQGHNESGKLKNYAHYEHGNPAFSLYTTPVEYAHYLCTMMIPNPRRKYLLRSEMVDAMLTPASNHSRELAYGLGWCMSRNSQPRYIMHGGSNGAGFRCVSRFYPDTGDGIVVMTNADSGAEVYSRVLKMVFPTGYPENRPLERL